MIGWRHQVGGDWGNYLRNYQSNEGLPLGELMRKGDPGYQFLEWVAHQFDWGVHGVNLVCGTIFALSLCWFCVNLSRPWLAMVVAVPYLVLVLGMGYSRQGVALSFIMLGLLSLGRGNVVRFVGWALLGLLFHKSAVLVLPMAALAAARNRWWAAVWVAVIATLSYSIFVQESVEHLREGFIVQRYDSQGAFVRLLMNLVPAIIFITFRRRFILGLAQGRMWYWYSVFSLVAFTAFFLVPSSAAVDRTALYLLPLQLVVFSSLPEVLGRATGQKTFWVAFVVANYAIVQAVWLTFATYSYLWIPYQFYPFTDEF